MYSTYQITVFYVFDVLLTSSSLFIGCVAVERVADVERRRGVGFRHFRLLAVPHVAMLPQKSPLTPRISRVAVIDRGICVASSP